MKQYIKSMLLVAFALTALAGFGMRASAATAPYVAWNTDVKDCPTISVANASTLENSGNTCWGPTVNAQPGDTINVRIYYHNTGTAAAGNTIVKLNMPTGTRSSFSFTGAVTGGLAQALGSGNINLSSPATLTLSKVAIGKDYSYVPTSYSTDGSLFTSGLSLGQINPPSDCPASNSFCHQGSVVASFIVGGSTTNTGSACSVTSFNANPSTVTAGSSSTLSWTTAGCTTVSISGLGSYGTNSSVSTGVLNGTQTYTLTATGTDGIAHTQSQTVTVNQVAQACSVTSFYANPTQVTSGSSANIGWSTTGCTNVSVSGPNVTSSQASGTASTGAVYGTQSYTITASGASNTVPAQTVTVTASTVNQNNCSISSFYASPSVVTYGGYSTIYWNTSGCTSATLSGNNASGSGTSSSVSTGPIYGTNIYTLTAYGQNGSPVSQTITVYSNANNTQGCIVTNAYASPATVNSGDSTILYWNNANGGAVSVTGGTLNSSYQYGSSITTGPIYGTTTYTITPVNCSSGGYAQSQSVTVYVNNNVNQYYGATTVTTTLATNVSAYSARLNGLIASTNGGSSVEAYFEYGTTEDLGQQTSQQLVSASGAENYFDTISTTPDTTYYYRAALVSNGTIYRGSIIAFTTPALQTNTGGNDYYVAPPVYVHDRTTYGVGAGSAYVSLGMTDQFQSVAPGDMIIYTVDYKNITTSSLCNVMLNVILPGGVTFRQSTQGVLTTSNTVVASIGTLTPGQEGTVVIQAMVDDTVAPGSTLVATSTLSFQLPSGAQDSAVAYAVNTVTQRNYLAGAAFLGWGGFFPSTLLGWVLLIAIIILIVLLIRRLSAPRVTPVVMQNGHDYHHGTH